MFTKYFISNATIIYRSHIQLSKTCHGHISGFDFRDIDFIKGCIAKKVSASYVNVPVI